MVLKSRDLRLSYKDNALRILFKYDEPSLYDVSKHVCLRGRCPAGDCENPGGFKKRDECGHILKIKSIVDKLLEVCNE